MEQSCLAQVVLEADAFDVIVTPINPTEALQTVRLALWQNRLLRLLTSKDRAATLFQKRMAAFPPDWKAEEYLRARPGCIGSTIETLQSSMRLFVNLEDEQVIFDIAASVAHCARQRAFGRLLHLNTDATTQ